MTNPTDDLGNPQVDFVWGPFPLQPNDQRGENTLDPTLDNHIIATSGYEGYPSFITGGVYDDTVPNATVPVLTGVLAATAAARLTAAGLTGVVLATTGNAGGATAQNNGKVASQSPAAGTVLNVEDEVEYSVYAYTAPGLITPTTNWSWTGMQGYFVFNAITSGPSELQGSGASSYNLVLTGGSYAGAYQIDSASWGGGTPLSLLLVDGFPAGMSSVEGSADGGVASIVAR